MISASSVKAADHVVDRSRDDRSAHAIWLAVIALYLAITIAVEVLK